MAQPTGNSDSSNGRPVVHVVDDEPMLLDLASAILEPAGFRVVRFRSAEAALNAYIGQPEKPVLLITDYAMGLDVMNGLELIEACRKIDPGQKALLVSGTVDESVCQQAPSKPDSFLAKPYQAPQLINIVRALTRG